MMNLHRLLLLLKKYDMDLELEDVRIALEALVVNIEQELAESEQWPAPLSYRARTKRRDITRIRELLEVLDHAAVEE
jgi:hypothetical protein